MTKKTKNNFSPEVRERAVRMLHEHQGEDSSQWAAIHLLPLKSGVSLKHCVAGYVKPKKRVAHKKS
jgi:hypothetical protein